VVQWKDFFLEKVNLLFLLNEQEAAKLRWAGVLGVFMSPKSRKRRLLKNHYAELIWLFCKTYFFPGIPFRSELRNWLFRGNRNASE
jgi:hypothetical protein